MPTPTTSSIKACLETRIAAALAAAGAPDAPALVQLSGKPQFGDYQANGCMAAAKKMRTNPRQFAETVLQHLDISDLAEKVELAGPGFINIFLKADWLTEKINTQANDDKLGLAMPAKPETVIVDYSSPNLAKEMHVGHLRSTIIGDALARIEEFRGNTVIRQNHVGDWGTQFGMLIAFLKQRLLEDPDGHDAEAELGDLENFYRQAKKKFDADEAFANAAREEVVGFQSGDPASCEILQRFLTVSMTHCQAVYEKLGVALTRDNVRGESAYNGDLPNVVTDLQAANLLDESNGATGVFLDEFKNKNDEKAFIIVRKSDGGYLYATTDLAAIRYRTKTLQASRVLYVTDSRQAQHFAQVFLIAKKAGFAPEAMSLEHVPFGMMLGTDGKPFKTRTGGTVKLMDLIDEAVSRADALVAAKNPDLSDDARNEIARVVGIGALKYADLSQNRASDYVFAWDKMISLEGNTAPYMQYAYARVRSIFRKAAATLDASDMPTGTTPIVLEQPAERALAVKLLQFVETLDSAAQTSLPNQLCSYLYELGGTFMSFYESCPVLKSEGPTRASRLRLCDLTARMIQAGLAMLGIKTIEKM